MAYIGKYTGPSYLPKWISPVVPADTINESEKSKINIPIAAANEVIPLIYGQVKLSPKIAYVDLVSNKLVCVNVWCSGPVQSIEHVWINDEDKAIPTSVELQHKLGGTDNNTIPTILSSIANYTDTLPKVCYTASRFTKDSNISGFPKLSALIKGLKVHDPRVTPGTISAYDEAHDINVKSWSDNPALCLADFISNSEYGMGRQVDWSSVATTANFNDTLLTDGVITERSRTLNLVLDKSMSCSQWIEVLRTYASCWVIDDSSIIKLVPDMPGSVVKDYKHEDGSILNITNIKKRGVLSTPNYLTVSYTNTSAITHVTDTYVQNNAGGGVVKESNISLLGINRRSQAIREAVERLDKLNLNDLSFDLEVFDDGIEVQPGDIIGVKHPIGIGILDGATTLPKPMRVIAVSTNSPGKYTLSCLEYDPAVYDTVVSTESTYTDTYFPNPENPPTIEELYMGEELYQLRNGSYQTRLRLYWKEPDWPYNITTSIKIHAESAVVASGTARASETAYFAAPFTMWADGPTVPAGTYYTWASPSIEENKLYTAYLYLVSSIGIQGQEPAIAQWTAIGKTAPPGDVSSLTGFEVGGEVRLTIGAAIDKDMTGYEVRYGAVDVTWNDAKFCVFVNAAAGVGAYVIYKDAPVGTFDFLACALDSTGQYSVNPKRLQLTVTKDNSSFLIGNNEYIGTPTLTGMVSYSLPGDSTRYYVTEDGDTAATNFPNTASTYTNIAATYHNSQTSTFVTEMWDIGVVVSGNWNGNISSTNISGTKTDSILLSQNGTDFVDQSTLSIKTSGRAAKLQSTASDTSTLKVTIPSNILRMDATPRAENGLTTTDTNGKSTIILSNAYSATKGIQLTPISSTAITTTYDNIQLCSTWARDSNEYKTVAGEEVVVFSRELLTSGTDTNPYNFMDFYQSGYNPSSYTTQAGDLLRFDYCVLSNPVGNGDVLRLHNGTYPGTGTSLATYNLNTVPLGQWGSGSVSVVSGYTVDHCSIVIDYTYAGSGTATDDTVLGIYRVALRNVRIVQIVDDVEVIQRILWKEGLPVVSQWVDSGHFQNKQYNMANTFDVYTFSGTSSAASKKVQWSFEGV